MSIANIPRPAGKSVWMGRDLAASREWLVRLPPATLAEIDAGLSRLSGRGVTYETLAPEDLPLHSFDAQIAGFRDEIAAGRGFVVLQGLEIGKYTLDQLRMIYWCFGRRFGVPKPQSYLGDLIGDIMDVSDEEPDPMKRRGYHSGGEQVTHTDSSDVVSMLSVRMAKAGGESRLCSAHTVHNLMLDTCPGLLEQFYQGFLLRTTDTDAAALGRPAFSGQRTPAFMVKDGAVNCSFVRGYVERAVRAGNHALSPVEKAALEAFEAFSNHPEVCLDYILEPGDMQFFNNRMMLHGRRHFEDHPEKTMRRHLLRLWLTVPEWPRMAPEQETHSDEARQKWGENARKQAVAAQ